MNTDVFKQIALGEEATVYAYEVLAARLPAGPERNRAVDLSVSHARARDRARAQLAAADTEPDVPGAFEIPFPMDGAPAARRLAALVEARLVDVYCRQIPLVEAQDRRPLASAAAEASARSVSWGGRPTAFPGGRESEPPEPSAPPAGTGSPSTPGSPPPATGTTPAVPTATAPPAAPGAQSDGATVG